MPFIGRPLSRRLLAAPRDGRSTAKPVSYTHLDVYKRQDPDNSGSLGGEVARARKRHGDLPLRVTEAGEWRLAETMRSWTNCTIIADDRFFSTPDQFAAWAEGRKKLRMESFLSLIHILICISDTANREYHRDCRG